MAMVKAVCTSALPKLPALAFSSTPFNLSSSRSIASRPALPRLVYTLTSAKRTFNPTHLRAMSTASAGTKTIAVGDKLPDATFAYLDKDGQVQTVSVADLTKGKKAVLFAVPGAFTPTCSQKHLPSFVDKANELRAKGIDTIACVSVNDAFVMRAWGESIGVGDKVLLLSDGNVAFTRALGVTLDLSDKPVGLGLRSRRYSLLAEDGVVKVLHLEEGGSFTTSGADDILKAL